MFCLTFVWSDEQRAPPSGFYTNEPNNSLIIPEYIGGIDFGLHKWLDQDNDDRFEICSLKVYD